ncbi:hypothetical protein ACSHXN_01170 [Streptomyces sp. HUAS TT11]|uniref:hypothetical protein n=1 Tax=Streptomyces sp. HUAS TT11 TaxID=3447508 RepID=UPI003F65EBDB
MTVSGPCRRCTLLCPGRQRWIRPALQASSPPCLLAWEAVRKTQGDAEGICALIKVARLHDHVAAGIAAALKAGALTADVVVLEARKAADADHPATDGPPNDPQPSPVASLTARRLPQLRADTLPLPSLAAYNALLQHRLPTARQREEQP